MTTQDTIAALRDRLDANIVGQPRLVEHLLIALLADGHVLLEGAPGLAKTRVSRLLATAFEGDFNRIQFTPDLLPSDLTGSLIYDPRDHKFEFQQGPLFGHFILADEINRAPAKVQSALLEAMEERQITSGETTYKLAAPFFVIATQNPIEHEGTWELPQAQLDRFLLHITVDYPVGGDERAILDLGLEEATEAAHTNGAAPAAENFKPIPADELARARESVLTVHISPLIRDYIVRLVVGTRNEPDEIGGVGEHLSHPISPRGSIGLARTAQARAWMYGRDHVLPEDIAAMAGDSLRHRMGLSYRAKAEGVDASAIIDTLLDQVSAI